MNSDALSKAPSWLQEAHDYFEPWMNITDAKQLRRLLDGYAETPPAMREALNFYLATLNLRAQATITKRLGLIQLGLVRVIETVEQANLGELRELLGDLVDGLGAEGLEPETFQVPPQPAPARGPARGPAPGPARGPARGPGEQEQPADRAGIRDLDLSQFPRVTPPTPPGPPPAEQAAEAPAPRQSRRAKPQAPSAPPTPGPGPDSGVQE